MSWGANKQKRFMYQSKAKDNSTTPTNNPDNTVPTSASISIPLGHPKQKTKRQHAYLPKAEATTTTITTTTTTTSATPEDIVTTTTSGEGIVVPLPPGCNLYTCGYAKFSEPEHFFAHLLQNNVTHLIDIRINPYSYNKQYNSNQLQEKLSTIGIQYEHYIELGNVFKGSDPSIFGEQPFVELLQTSGEILTRRLRKALACTQSVQSSEKVQGNEQQKLFKIAIMCACADANNCHRKSVAEYMSNNWNVTINHL